MAKTEGVCEEVQQGETQVKNIGAFGGKALFGADPQSALVFSHIRTTHIRTVAVVAAPLQSCLIAEWRGRANWLIEWREGEKT